MPQRRGERRGTLFALVQRNEGVKALVILKSNEELEDTNCRLPKQIASICEVKIGQSLEVSRPRIVPLIRYVELEFIVNCGGDAVNEEQLRPYFLVMKGLNKNQEVTITKGKLVVKVAVIIPDRYSFGEFGAISRIILPRNTAQEEE